MQQKISVAQKCSWVSAKILSSTIIFNINNNKKCFLNTKIAYKNDFCRIMWHWRLETFFHRILFSLNCRSNKCSLGEHEKLLSKKKQKITNRKNFWTALYMTKCDSCKNGIYENELMQLKLQKRHPTISNASMKKTYNLNQYFILFSSKLYL